MAVMSNFRKEQNYIPILIGGDFNISLDKKCLEKTPFRICPYEASPRREKNIIDYFIVTEELDMKNIKWLNLDSDTVVIDHRLIKRVEPSPRNSMNHDPLIGLLNSKPLTLEAEKLEISKKDGNSFFYSAITAIKNVLKNDQDISKSHNERDFLLDVIQHQDVTDEHIIRLRKIMYREWVLNAFRYVRFVENLFYSGEYSQQTKYFMNDGYFATDLGNVKPLVSCLSNALGITVIVFYDDLSDPAIFRPEVNKCYIEPICIAKRSSGPWHFDACIKTQEQLNDGGEKDAESGGVLDAESGGVSDAESGEESAAKGGEESAAKRGEELESKRGGESAAKSGEESAAKSGEESVAESDGESDASSGDIPDCLLGDIDLDDETYEEIMNQL